MNFNLRERTGQTARTNPPTNTGTNKSANRSASDSRTYDKDLALAIERSLKTITVESNPENNNLSQEGLRRRANDVPIEMRGALAPGEEPISDPLEILSTAERTVGWQTPVHDTTPVDENEVTDPGSSWVIKREDDEEEEGPPVPEKDSNWDGISARDWAYQPGFTSDGRPKGKGKAR